VKKLFESLSLTRRVISQERELRTLREEAAKLREQNERMRQGMRRCTTCEYRLQVVGRR
jgi:hypothetical protein